ncbi:hypothetical protein [Nocardioides jensenii]|uniref:hypothetical protein n=1 Tax=Nocardioides jensenii TaxID=1843 RepID=UPI000A98185E|nr:hypothetical protein [Nocardioides jensenii]
MKVPMTVLRVVTLGPALLVSFVLAVVVFAVVPPLLGLVLFLAWAAVLVALALGQLEDTALGLLTGSRPASEAEARVMAPVLAELGGRGIDVGSLYVRRVQRPQTPVALAIGHRAVVITPGLVEGTYRGAVSGAEAVAVLAHAVGRRRAIRPRLETAVLAATTPWRMVVAAFRGVGQAFAWLPFMRVAWTLRGVVGGICVVQSVAEGRTWPGLLGGTVIALTYLVPAAGRVIEARADAGADQLVVELGLGGVLAGLLRRYGYPMTLERLHRLEASATPPQRPRLHLVPD